MSLLAIDIGSSACKAVAFALDGTSLAQHSCSYAPELPQPSFAELNPEAFWEAVRTCCRTVASRSREPVRALCLSSHGETFIPVDDRGRPLMNAILNQDTRATGESAWCEEIIGRKRLFQITGLCTHPMFPLPKILWLRKHRPEIFAATRSFVSLIGYLLSKMGLAPWVDFSLASRYLAFDVRGRGWSEEILQAVGLDRARLPLPAAPGTIVGELPPTAAAGLGLAPGIAVVMGGHDQPCSALGSGVIETGRVAHSIGTYECLVAASDAPSLSDVALSAALNSYCHVVPDKYVTLAYFPSGIMVQWFHRLLHPEGSADPDVEAGHYAFLEAQAPAGPTGLTVTPHLIGTCNPDFNPRARSLIAGLQPGSSRAHIHKGILEGLACELALLTNVLAQAVGDFRDLYVTGGGVRSPLGLKLRAALTGCRLHVMQQQQAVCLGTAILAGVAIGEYAHVQQAIEAVVRESDVITPDESLAERYAGQRTRYQQLRSLAATLD